MEKENNFITKLLKFRDEENEKVKVDSINRIKSIYSQIMTLKTDREKLKDNFYSDLLAFFDKCCHRFDVVSCDIFSVFVRRIWKDSDHLNDEEQYELKLYESCEHIMQNIRDANELLNQYKYIVQCLNDRHIHVDEKEFEEIDIDNLERFVPSRSDYVFDVYVDEDSNEAVSCHIRENFTRTIDLIINYEITLNTHSIV